MGKFYQAYHCLIDKTQVHIGREVFSMFYVSNALKQ